MMLITVDDELCEARIRGLNLGTRISVRGRDENGDLSGYVFLDGEQICEGFKLQGATMLYDSRDPLSEYLRRQCRKSGRRYRVKVERRRTVVKGECAE